MKDFYYYIYIFTLLKLKNQIKLQLTNIEQYIFIWIHPFGVCLHLCISSVKCCRFVITGGRFVITGGRFVIKGGRFVITGARFVITGGRFVITGGRFVITGGRIVITGGRFASYFHCESIVWKFTHLSILIINYTRIEILVDRCLSFFCWSLYCLSFDLPILIYRFVSSNSSYKHYQNDMFFI